MSACAQSNSSSEVSAEAIVIKFCTFASDRRLLMAVLKLFWRLNPRSAATLETGITSASSAKVLKSGNISPSEVMRSLQDSLNKGFPDPESTRFTGRISRSMRSLCTGGSAAPRGLHGSNLTDPRPNGSENFGPGTDMLRGIIKNLISEPK